MAARTKAMDEHRAPRSTGRPPFLEMHPETAHVDKAHGAT
jgi:hypothetical protein